MKGLAIVVGLPGVGKSTVLEKLKENASKQRVKLQIINYGTVMMEVSSEKSSGITHRDEIRRRSTTLQHELQAEAARRIASKAEAFNGVTIIDTHLIVRTLSGYLPGLPAHVLEILKPNLLALIEASAEEIASRRIKDSEIRMRESLPKDEILFELQLSRVMAAAASTISGAPIIVVENREGKAEEAAIKILEMVKHTVGG
jgi:adenylate kinase